MSELKLFYHIVPENSGCEYLCSNGEELFLRKKEGTNRGGEILFNDEISAEKFIDDNNLVGYIVEPFCRIENWED